MRLLSYLITIPIAVALILFAISNQGMVVVELWPLPFASRPLPLYTIVLVPAAVAFFLGGLIVWLGGTRTRRLARQRKRAVENLRAELGRVQASKTRMDQAMAKASEAQRIEAATRGAEEVARRELPSPDRAA